jgi:hypothetical protein
MHFYGIWSLFKEGRPPIKRGADGLFGEKERRGTLYLTGVENTAREQRPHRIRFL